MENNGQILTCWKHLLGNQFDIVYVNHNKIVFVAIEKPQYVVNNFSVFIF